MIQPRALRLIAFLFTLATLALALLSACSSGTGRTSSTQSAVSAKLVNPADPADLERRFKAELTRRYERQYAWYSYQGSGFGGGPVRGTADTQDAAAPSSAFGGGSSLPHSETNVQEKGIDEGDLVKTDGAFIYLARGSRFLVLKAQPPEQSAVVSDIDLGQPIAELHLSGGRIALITGPFMPVAPGPAIAGFCVPIRSATRVHFYDVTTPASPTVTAVYDFPGHLRGSRRIGDTLYLVTNHSVDLPSPVEPSDYLTPGTFDPKAFGEASAKARAENLKRIEALTLADLVPTYSRTTYSLGVAQNSGPIPALDWNDVYIPESSNGTDLSLVFAIDTAAGPPAVASTGVLSSWCRIYMSPDALYLASDNDWFRIEPAAGTDEPPANPEPLTAVHKFAVAAGTGGPLYRGSGLVKGLLNDQFSMGEHNGFLRIGTTRGGWWGEGISNRLAVLAERDGALVETGAVEGLAPGERIYAMRFDRDRGYMVTFRQTDPLFTFDLSDPNNPRMAGEIKVSGFATYIHLMGQDNNRLLTIGRSADATGRVTGNKLQLFDVTNLATPQLLGEYELGAGWSDALYDYHAFLYYEPLALLAIPYFGAGSASAPYDSGLRLFTADGTGIAPRGVIPAPAVPTGNGISYYDTVDRAVMIGTDIYSVAHRTVTVADAGTLGIKNVVQLPEGYQVYQTPPILWTGVGMTVN